LEIVLVKIIWNDIEHIRVVFLASVLIRSSIIYKNHYFILSWTWLLHRRIKAARIIFFVIAIFIVILQY